MKRDLQPNFLLAYVPGAAGEVLSTMCLRIGYTVGCVPAKSDFTNLSQYAKDMKVYKKMMSVMEVFLNGRCGCIRTCTADNKAIVH